MKYDKLEKLHKLKEKGMISEEEYEIEKNKILRGNDIGTSINELFGLSQDTYCMLIHLTQFCGYIIPIAGMIIPVLLWQINKSDYFMVDEHGKVVANWILSSLIYKILFFILCFLLIGIPLLYLLILLEFIFIIIGAIRAKNGTVWKYPFSISFF